MKSSGIIYSLLICSISCAGQVSNTWYFGDHAGIGFSASGVTALSNSAMSTTEGCALMSDAAGNLLFYTDGVTIYNRNHQAMANGTGLMGHASSSVSALVAPFPGRPGRYLVFTADAVENQFFRGYRYSVVDMRLSGGLGEVTTKNILAGLGGTERMALVKHHNGNDYWLVTKDRDGNAFRAYLINCAGVSKKPVITNTGVSLVPTPYPSHEGIGYLNASPSGDKIGMTVWDGNQRGAYLYHFNNATGVLTDPITLSTNNLNTIYGIAFSPSGQMVYVSFAQNNFIRQYNVSNWNATAINASAYPIATFKPYGLQTGPDNRMYVAKAGTVYLALIAQPDLPGASCMFQDSALHLQAGVNGSGLPSFPNAYATLYDSGVDADTIPLQGTISYTIDHCRVLLNATSNGTGNTSYHWDFGDGLTSSGQSVTHLYADTGTFTVRLQIHDTRTCKEDSVLVQQQITITNKLQLQFTSTGTCANDQVQFTNQTVDSNSVVQTWHWQFGDGQSAQSLHATHIYLQGGLYSVKLQAQFANGCNYSTTAIITIEQPVAFAGNDTAAKKGTNLQLQGSGGAQYEWSPATNLSDPFISNPVAFVAGDINYVLKVISATGCTDIDTVHIKAFDRYEVYVPDAFTPNGDGRNDRLRPLGFGIRALRYFRIYNRWGQLVYATSQLQSGWDGRINSRLQAPDVYVWLLEAEDLDGKRITRKGTSLLLR